MTICNQSVRAAALAGAALALGNAQAHHSYGAFDRCNATTLEGEVIGVEWANPHIVINVRTADVSSYRVEWRSLPEVERVGLARDTFELGDQLVIRGHAMRDPTLKVLSLVSEIHRPSDGWSWKHPRRPAPPNCPAG